MEKTRSQHTLIGRNKKPFYWLIGERTKLQRRTQLQRYRRPSGSSLNRRGTTMALPTLDLFCGEAPSSISSSFCWVWAADVRELVAALFRFRLSVCLWMEGSQLCQWNNYKILFSFNAVKFRRYNIEPAAFWTLVVQCHGSTLSQAPSKVGHRWRELESKFVPQWFLGSLLGTHQSAIGQFFFFPVPSKVPEVFAKLNPAQFPSVASRVAGSRATECSPEGIWSVPILIVARVKSCKRLEKYKFSFPNVLFVFFLWIPVLHTVLASPKHQQR